MIYRSHQGVEQSAEPGTPLYEILERDPNWSRVDRPAKPTPMPALDRLSRKEIDAIALEAGVENPARLKNKAKVIEAIRKRQAE